MVRSHFSLVCCAKQLHCAKTLHFIGPSSTGVEPNPSFWDLGHHRVHYLLQFLFLIICGTYSSSHLMLQFLFLIIFQMELDNLNNNINCDHEIFISHSKGTKRSIAERRGFNSNAARINTALLIGSSTSITPSPSYSPRSPHLTIPPGISPTALLDSPIMLSNSQV